jgi:hypothetical protein
MPLGDVLQGREGHRRVLRLRPGVVNNNNDERRGTIAVSRGMHPFEIWRVSEMVFPLIFDDTSDTSHIAGSLSDDDELPSMRECVRRNRVLFPTTESLQMTEGNDCQYRRALEWRIRQWWVGRLSFCTISSDTHTLLTSPRREYMPIAFRLV